MRNTAKTMTTQYCQARLYMPGTARSFPCGAKAKVTRDGVCYCGRHDPVALKAAHDKREAVLKLERDALTIHREKNEAARAEQARRAALFDELVAMVETLANGLRWNIEHHPTVMNQSDDEALQNADELLEKARAS